METAKTKSSREFELEAENRRLRRLLDESGRATEQAKAVVDSRFDEFDRVSESLIRSGEFLRRVLASSGDCIKVLDLDGRLQFMSAGGMVAREIDDFAPFVGRPWLDFWAGEFAAAARAAVDEAKAGREGRFQGFCPTAKGTPRWWDVQVLPLLGVDGKPEQLLSVSTDITVRKRAEDRQQVLMQELEHRVKNTLALVQSIASQTFRNASSMDEARHTFTERLLALSRAHDVLMRTSWTSASIGTIIASAIAPYRDDEGKRFLVKGTELSLAARSALALTMALHELCTNSVKYGALSSQSGRVSIEWRIEDGAGAPRLKFAWVERGGPPVQPPSRKGFGSRLIERSLAVEFDGKAELIYAPEGLVCMIDASLAAVQETVPDRQDASPG